MQTMSHLTQAEIRNNALAFVQEWKTETRESAEAQTFWNEFLEIFGVKRRRVAVFEKAVKKTNQNTGAIDLFWRGLLLAEHKSRGVKVFIECFFKIGVTFAGTDV